MMARAELVPASTLVGPLTIHHLEHVMGTVVVIDVNLDREDQRLDAASGIERAAEILHAADAVFSTWKEDSQINQVRRGDITIAKASSEMADVLEACTIAKDLSQGWFDPWAMPGGVDPTGFVKGWAAQRALDELRTTGATSAIVNAAGDIATFGRPQTDAPFRIGIVDPYAPQSLAFVVELSGAIATSGTYERGEHLLDPRSGRHLSRAVSASVVGPDLGMADAFATALAISGEQGLAFIEPHEGYEGLLMCSNGAWKWTAGFPFA